MINKIKKEFFSYFKKYESGNHKLNYLFWECTTRCNLNCLHCGSDCTKNSNYNDMPLDNFLSAIETIPQNRNSITIVLTGGEPLLRKDLEICGKEIRKRGFRWSMVSNGHLYNEEKHNSLLNAGIGALTFSLDGLGETHNWLRNSKSNFEKADKAIELVVSSQRINFDVVTCVNQKNIYELPQIKDYLIKKGVKSWRLFTIVPIGRAKDNKELFLSDNQFKILMDYIKLNRKNGEIDIKFSCEGYLGDYDNKVRDGFFFCRAGINIGSVLIDGSISACPNIDRSFAQGNIYRDNFYDTWQLKFQDFRNRQWAKTGQCKECPDFKYCQGNGLHYWHGKKDNVLVCHKEKIENVSN